MRKALVLIGCAVAGTWVLVSCGSTNSGTAPVPPVFATLPTTGDFNKTITLTPAPSVGATSIPVPLPSAGQYAGKITLPVTSVPPALKLTMTYSNTVPNGLTAFSAARRTQSANARTPLDELNRDVVYACLSANEPVQLSQPPYYSYTLPIGFFTSGVAYYGAIYQKGSWIGGYAGPGSLAAGPTTLNVTMTGSYGFAIPADTNVCAALYGRETSAPTPTPAMSGVLNLNSPTLTFTASAPQTITATETGYSGVFNAKTANPTIATVVAGTASGQIVVTPVAIGTTTITVTAGTQTATVTVHVTALTPGATPTPTPALSLNESFAGSNSTANAWASVGDACLTAGSASTASTSVPACVTNTPDPPGLGTLQLTTNGVRRTGFVISKTAIATTGGGVKVGFDYFAFDGTGGDGMSFFLLDGLAIAAGASGSGLGYAPATNAAGHAVPGISHAYLGIGLDSYGNFSVAGLAGGPATGEASRIHETVALRGAASTNYQYMGGFPGPPSAPASLPFPLDFQSSTRPAPLHVLLIVDTRQQTITVTIAAATFMQSLATAGQPPFPAKVYLGFAASTGDFTDVHQIRNVTIDALP